MRDAGTSSLLRAAIWVAIGALIAAAIVCVVWLFVGSQDGIIGKAFLTILLLVAFSGAAILDAHLAPRRPAWFALSSMIGWVALLLIGAVMIWMPERAYFASFTRFIQFLLIVLIVQLALLHLRLFVKASQRYVTGFTRTVTVVTIALVVGLAALLMAPLVLWEYVDFRDLYWRFVVAAAILAAVGSTLIPLVNVLFAPKKERAATPPFAHVPAAPMGHAPALAAGGYPPAADAAAPEAHAGEPELLPWPTYVDGVTPLPYMPDGQPDWGAYYSGDPSPGAQVFGPIHPPAPAPQPEAPQNHPVPPQPGFQNFPPPQAPPGYDGFPPPPPLPPRP
ncbi:hypothetical protein [Microbacterium sp. SLBN-146]|uniref:hypothetical protein n=1 Tax=Microbacterium sp. SLBN-146 TaxID=2768457 RepID=UPI0021B187DD|nr:hypothetical protein [Microbacterium sp. SLBN-146]